MSKKKLIDADIVMEDLMNQTAGYGQPSMLHKVIRDTINDLPYLETDEDTVMNGATVAPISSPTAHLEFNQGENIDYWTCSSCGEVVVIRGNYCPHCGAYFEKEEENE